MPVVRLTLAAGTKLGSLSIVMLASISTLNGIGYTYWLDRVESSGPSVGTGNKHSLGEDRVLVH